MKPTNPYTRYLLKYLLVLILFIPLPALNYLFLTNTYELVPVQDIVAVQRKVGGIFGSALYDRGMDYVNALYSEVRPEVIAMGSSRVYQIRQSYFNVPFVNIGKGNPPLNRLIPWFDELSQVAAPKVVLMELDPWWFTQTACGQASHQLAQRSEQYEPSYFLLPIKWLIRGEITPSYYWQAIVSHPSTRANPYTFGVKAQIDKDGLGPDGSYYYLSTIYGLTHKFTDREFQETLAHVVKGDGFFLHNQKISETCIDYVKDFSKHLEKKNVSLFIFMPPIAKAVQNKMNERGQEFAYFTELREKLKSLPSFYDFFDPESLPSNDCEFVDGIHGGDTAYLRILDKMATGPSSQALDNRLISKELRSELINNNSGRAFIPDAISAKVLETNQNEIDFLGIGCKKGD